MTSTYFIKIIKTKYNKKDVTLYIQVIPTGAIGPYIFPYDEDLKAFFLMALCNIYNNNFLPKKRILDLELPLGKKSTNIDFERVQNTNDMDGGILTFKLFQGLNVDDYDNFKQHESKFIKEVIPYDNSYERLIGLLKKTEFEQVSKEENKSDKTCLNCGKQFKYKNMSIEKLIAKAKSVTYEYNEEGEIQYDDNLIKDYIKNKTSISITEIPIIDEDIYTLSEQNTDTFYFNSPQEIIYYCCSIRFCSTICATNDIKNKTWEEVFDGKDILHTYLGNYYKVVLHKKYVNTDIIKNLINKSFCTVA